MTSHYEARRLILAEITADQPEVRSDFMKRYSREADQFAALMAKATLEFESLAASVGKDDKIVFVANIVYCAIALHVQSMKLFLSGHIVPYFVPGRN